MNFSTVDWVIVGAMLAGLVVMALVSNRHTKSVADYLAAGRAAGRYMMTMASGMVWIGAINVVAMFELYHSAGFTAMWWVMLTTPFALYLNITGFGVYRFRETRALTIAQFLETRYSRAARVMAGVLAWVAGLINFGLFPAVGARFFIAFAGLPTELSCGGLSLPTFPVVMAALLGVSLFFVFAGGHVAVLVTDCLQGVFTQIAAIVIVVVLLVTTFDWSKMVEVLIARGDPAAGRSLLDPLQAGAQAGGFTFWFFVIGMIGLWYGVLSNMQGQAYVASARTAHEFRMGAALNQWRWQALLVFFMVLALSAMVILHHPDHAEDAAAVNQQLDSLVAGQPNEAAQNALRGQLVITTALSRVIPEGLAGLFCAIMLAALISTYDSFMHTWGAVFLQDVVMPFRKSRFGTRQHLWLLRLSILGVALFAFIFSWCFANPENILMYFALVNNIWLGGSGAVLLGGLYWGRGTNRAAVGTMLAGAVMGIYGIVVTLGWPAWFEGVTFPINPQWWFFITIVTNIVVYVVISLDGSEHFNMEKLLHRGKYRLAGETGNPSKPEKGYHHLFGVTPEFNAADRRTAYLIMGWFLFWMLFFCVGTAYAVVRSPSEAGWAGFWRIYLYILFAMGLVIAVWLSWGGLRDTADLFRSLKSQQRDFDDDGMVRHDPEDDGVCGNSGPGSEGS